MLSRSSDRSTRQRSVTTSELNSHNASAAGISSHAQVPSPINPHGFGFQEEPFAHDEVAETPTLRSGGGTPALRSPSGRRRVVVFEDGNAGGGSRASAVSGGQQQSAAAGGLLSSSSQLGAGISAVAAYRRRPSTSDTPDMHSPGSDTRGVGGLGGLRYAASSRSLSQAALSEMAEREQQERQERQQPFIDRFAGGGTPYESGASADRTTVVLGKSASFQAQRESERAAAAAASSSGGAGGGSGPYQSFAPLEELVNAVTESAASRSAVGMMPLSIGGASAASGASGAPSAVVCKGVLPMLQPEYILTPNLSRLKAELAGAARRSPPQLLRFDEQLDRVMALVRQFEELDAASAKVCKTRLIVVG